MLGGPGARDVSISSARLAWPVRHDYRTHPYCTRLSTFDGVSALPVHPKILAHQSAIPGEAAMKQHAPRDCPQSEIAAHHPLES